jgi:hypothetical protein
LGKLYFVLLFFVAINILKLYIIILQTDKEIFLAKTIRIVVPFTQKFVIKLSKIIGFGIRDPEKPIPDPGSRVKKSTEPASAPLHTCHPSSLQPDLFNPLPLSVADPDPHHVGKLDPDQHQNG